LNADFSYTNCWSTWLCAHLWFCRAVVSIILFQFFHGSL
jgi:hypothetical protein